MKKLVLDFPNQLQEALIIGKHHKFAASAEKKFSNVVVTGLGGSGIGASIVQNFVFDKLLLPFVVNKDYFIPAFVDKHSLVIVCSYSGNTEETLMAMEQAIKAHATIVCITSGGAIANLADKEGLDCILVPGGMPPRACLGYSLVQILYTLAHFSLLANDFEDQIKSSVKQLKEQSEAIQQKAAEISNAIFGKLPIVYASSFYEGVAIRFRQQLNENSKMLGWQGVIPEMNHNELVGWRDDAKDKVVVILRNTDDYERVQTRMEINKQVFEKYTSNIIEIYSEGNSYFEKAFYLIHITDWISVILADLRQLDATEVNVIDFLKKSLAKG